MEIFHWEIWHFKLNLEGESNSYLITGLALALLVTPVHPVVVGGRLLSVLSGPDIPKAWFAGELDVLDEGGDAVRVCDDFTRAALETSAIFLQ